MNSAATKTKTLEIFRAGTHVSGSGDRRTWTEADLQEIASSYNADRFKAPLIVSHDTKGIADDQLPNSELAYGYPDSLKVVGSRLIGSFSKIVPQVSNWIKDGQIFAVSPSIYLPNSPANPTPGKFALRHIALLGKSPPAVKGMEAPSFSIPISDFDADATAKDSDAFNCSFDIVFNETEELMTTQTTDKVKDPEFAGEMPPALQKALDKKKGKTAPEDDEEEEDEEEMSPPAKKKKAKPPEMSETPQVSAADFAALQAELAAIKKQAETERQAFALRQAAAERKEVESFVAQQVEEGRLLPTHKNAWTYSLLAIPSNTEVSYSEGETPSSVRDRIQQMIREMPSVVELQEMAGVNSAPNSSTQVQGFSAVEGYALDPESSKTMQQALAYCEKQGWDTGDNSKLVAAIQAVSK